MLKAEQIKELAKRAGCSSEVLAKALSSTAEETLTFDAEGEFITTTDLEQIKERAGKDSYAEGKKAGEEMIIKAIRTDEKLEFEGKTKENLVTALKAKIQKEVGTEPTKRITELENDIRTLQKNLEDKELELTTATEKYNSQLDGLTIEQTIKSKIPEKLANGLTRDDAYTLFMAKNKVQKTAEGIVLIDPETKQPVKDRHLKPVSIDDHLKTFVESFGKVNEDGRKLGDDLSKSKTNIELLTKRSEVEKYFEDNKTPLSEQSGILAKAMKNEGFDING